jgi:hypothetical protein
MEIPSRENAELMIENDKSSRPKAIRGTSCKSFRDTTLFSAKGWSLGKPQTMESSANFSHLRAGLSDGTKERPKSAERVTMASSILRDVRVKRVKLTPSRVFINFATSRGINCILIAGKATKATSPRSRFRIDLAVFSTRITPAKSLCVSV